MISVEMVIAGLFGLVLGSFLNVCIYRLPLDLLVWKPARSFCPACEKPIAWFDNIPLVSYALLKGKCRSCASPISFRYPLVEILTAVCFISAVSQSGLSLATAKLCLYSLLIIGCIFTDFSERILPDEFTLGGAVAGLLFAWFVFLPPGLTSFFIPLDWGKPVRSLAEAAFGGLFPSLTIWGIGELYYRIRKREGLGFGDVKMILMMGAFWGLTPTLFSLMAGSAIGSFGSLAYILLTRKDASSYELPFGSFLGLATLAMQHAIRPDSR